MIAKANQRGGGQQLATHLLNAYDNERVEITQVRGAVAEDLHGAFAEWSALAKATNCRKYLYSLSVNPDPAQGELTRDQYLDFIARTEKRLGLSDQPRAVVFHVKEGREHCHVVWSRIDPDRLKAVQLSHDRQKLRFVARDFARDHGLALPRGMRRDGTAARFNDRAALVSLAEKQQEERSGITKEQRRAVITAAWNQTKTGKAFAAALAQAGYYLARGKRGYVVTDRAGEIHSLARQIDGARKKDVDKRLTAAYPLDKLPAADKARSFAHQREARQRAAAQKQELSARFQNTTAARRDRLTKIQARRREQLNERRKALEAGHRVEREALREAQKAERDATARRRANARPKGLRAFLARITGIQTITAIKQRRQDRHTAAAHKRQTMFLERRHGREMQDFQRHYSALARVEKRELRSFTTAQRREWRQELLRARTPAPDVSLKPAFNERAASAAQQPSRKPPAALVAEFLKAAGLNPDREGSQKAVPGKTPPQEQPSRRKAADPLAGWRAQQEAQLGKEERTQYNAIIREERQRLRERVRALKATRQERINQEKRRYLLGAPAPALRRSRTRKTPRTSVAAAHARNTIARRDRHEIERLLLHGQQRSDGFLAKAERDREIAAMLKARAARDRPATATKDFTQAADPHRTGQAPSREKAKAPSKSLAPVFNERAAPGAAPGRQSADGKSPAKRRPAAGKDLNQTAAPKKKKRAGLSGAFARSSSGTGGQGKSGQDDPLTAALKKRASQKKKQRERERRQRRGRGRDR